MNSIFVFNEFYSNGYKVEVLEIITLFSILFGILVIIINNPIVSVLFLICLFVSIASYLSFLGLNFIGLSYLLVYVGAVSILFLFILMLINVRVSELTANPKNSIPLALFICISFSYPVERLLPYSAYYINNSLDEFNFTFISTLTNKFQFIYDLIYLNDSKLYDGGLSYVTSKVWDGNLAETNHISSIGNVMYTSYSIWLILTSVILLLAMVGSIIITIKQKN